MPSGPGERYDFFLSRRGSMAAIAREVADVLTEKGYKVLVQDYDIPLGASFVEEMHEAIINSRDLIILFTEDYLRSPYTRKEFTSFEAERVKTAEDRHIIVLRCDGKPACLITNSCPVASGDGTEGQSWLDAQVGDAEVIILDNVSTLVRERQGKRGRSLAASTELDAGPPRAGKTIIFFHHAGKGGAQRGTSRREDVLDTVISLRRPADYLPEQGARFEVHFEKARGFHEEAQPFEAKYEVRDGVAVWTRTEMVDAERARVVAAVKDGMSIRETAEALGIHRSKVERLRKRAMETGELPSAPARAAAE
jgi:hypothetical protein